MRMGTPYCPPPTVWPERARARARATFDASGHMVRERESQRENARERERESARESERERAREREQGPNVHSGQTCTQQSCTKNKYKK